MDGDHDRGRDGRRAGRVGATGRRAGVRRILKPAIAVAAVVLAAFLLHRTLSNYSAAELAAAVVAVPWTRLAGAAGFAAASYLCLTGFDYLGLRYAGRPLAYRRAALTSFTSLSLGHNIGFAALSSGAVRYRFYSRWGLDAADVGRVILFCGATVGLGLMTLGGMALLAMSETASELTGLGRTTVLALGAANLALVGAYLALAGFRHAPFRLWRWETEIPSLRLASAQVAVGAANFTFVAACLHQATAAVADVPFLGVASVFVIANVTALVSHVPGGWGVIETVVARLLPGADVIGAILVFRIVYYLVPLGLGGAALAVSELVLRRAKETDGGEERAAAQKTPSPADLRTRPRGRARAGSACGGSGVLDREAG